jgi:hypothetical protein
MPVRKEAEEWAKFVQQVDRLLEPTVLCTFIYFDQKEGLHLQSP